MEKLIKSFNNGTNELFLVIGMVGILLVLFTPISPGALDFLLLINFCLALLILLVTFYTDKPLSFSTFPSLLLMTTLFRLALNISATRLILDGADAGEVIDAVGKQVVGGNYIIGLVVFLILIVVQYVVVTNGAQRVAEVAARFILDSLPGKQMSIDADLNMGIIDQDEAKKRRGELEKESNFYGAMDGASKFVKGDAIAGIIIILIDIIGGLTIGLTQKGMDWGEALHVYTLLTVGDGIVTQIPSLIIAVSTGIIITRAATDTRLAEEITNQFSAHPKTMVIVGIALACLMFVPGIPVIPVILIFSVLMALAWFSYRKRKKSGSNTSQDDKSDDEKERELRIEEELKEIVQTSTFELSMGKELAGKYLANSEELDKRVSVLRKQTAKQIGIILPSLTVKQEGSLDGFSYSISIHGMEIGSGSIKPGKLLAINPGGDRPRVEGEKTIEPTYGLSAQWIDTAIKSQAQAAGYTLVDAETVLITHIQELTKKNASDFITRVETERLIESKRDEIGSLIDELIPAILTYSDVQRVLQNLVSEQVPIKNMEAILEVLAFSGRTEKDPEVLCEKVREKLNRVICQPLADSKGQIRVVTLSPAIEKKMLSAISGHSTGSIGLTPMDMEQFVSKSVKECEKQLNANITPILLCAAPLRRKIRSILLRTCPQMHVLSTAEVSKHQNIVSAGMIEIDVMNTQIAS
ncbi:Flagellar biosynthesis protein FlhA [Thalassocella blandensis]|nr:Flagellar biosynthesis protein FlhA [Thalassocella blandensis]